MYTLGARKSRFIFSSPPHYWILSAFPLFFPDSFSMTWKPNTFPWRNREMMSVGQGKAADQKRGQRNKCRERGIPQTVQNEILDTLKNKQTKNVLFN